MTVLIVDDDTAIRLLCRVNLELRGLRVVEAAYLDQARQVLAEEPVDVVLLDLHLGHERGLDLLHELRRDPPPKSSRCSPAAPSRARQRRRRGQTQ